MAASEYLANALLEHTFGKGAFAVPTIWVGLSTTTPAADGTNVTEPAGEDAYARVQTVASDWSSAGTPYAEGTLKNAEPIEFAEATGSWGTVTHLVLYDAETDGNMLAFSALTQEKIIGSGDTARFAAEGIAVTLS
jgi:hypothetical protein